MKVCLWFDDQAEEAVRFYTSVLRDGRTIGDPVPYDEVWNALIADGGSESPCGWCKDRFGMSWQVVPTGLQQYLGGPDEAGRRRATEALFSMRKIDIDAIRRAYEHAPTTA